MLEPRIIHKTNERLCALVRGHAVEIRCRTWPTWDEKNVRMRAGYVVCTTAAIYALRDDPPDDGYVYFPDHGGESWWRGVYVPKEADSSCDFVLDRVVELIERLPISTKRRDE